MPSPAARGLVGPAAAFAAVASATAYVGVVDPGRPGHYPVCPFLRATGWWCPGCGGLRCVHALTRGDLATAVHDNVLAVLACTAAVLVWAHWTYRSARGLRTVLRLPGPGLAWALGAPAVVLAFTVLRNLPAGAFLAP
ncbi:DUF2752 domain-containing protein [Streptacidiphilus sp. PB12-B1b]|uniref:DUF2752 domain-containing protein n=1 Tax=Streptacidiphilus sp. PB12-B1b TaxID=2705012 RepID=UPI001CDD3E31|nr:DUF2752 domain-containing protein [Streptacidiphilus sp. PB12-B1b]